MISEIDQQILSTFIDYMLGYKANDSFCNNIHLDSSPDAIFAISSTQQSIYNNVFIKDVICPIKLAKEFAECQLELKIPLTVWVTEQTKGRSQIETHFYNAFSSPGAFYGMSLDLTNEECLPIVDCHFRIEEVKNIDQAEQFSELFCRGFNFQSMFAKKLQLTRNQLSENPSTAINCIAKVNNIPVGIASLLLNGKSGGLYDGCVLPEYRCQGVGQLLAQYLVNKAKQSGMKQLSVVLMSDAMARGCCERLGFVNYSTLVPFNVC